MEYHLRISGKLETDAEPHEIQVNVAEVLFGIGVELDPENVEVKEIGNGSS